ncbi:hypothetical protein TNCV_4980101 [Trichonephila clavipes]|nr:hypothetical protein TNCV_4980101 [Trichonephila clavipes]
MDDFSLLVVTSQISGQALYLGGVGTAHGKSDPKVHSDRSASKPRRRNVGSKAGKRTWAGHTVILPPEKIVHSLQPQQTVLPELPISCTLCSA